MARTTLTKTTPPGSYAGAGTTLTLTAADVTNKNQFVASGNDLVIAYNSGAGAATITITSVDDPFGRREDIAAESIAAGAYKLFGPFKRQGWAQSDGYIYLEASSVDVKFAVIAA